MKMFAGFLAGAVATIVCSTSSAQTYFRYSVVDGHPNVPVGLNNNSLSPFKCFDLVYGNNITVDDVNCLGLMTWQISPPSKHTGSSHSIYPWVQGWEDLNTPFEARAWSYTKNGVTSAWTSQVGAPYGDFDYALGTLTVPKYGTFTVVGQFDEPGGNGTGTRWHSVAYNYN